MTSNTKLFSTKSAKQVKELARLSLMDPKRCVLCIIPGCYMADLCSLPEGKKYRLNLQPKLKEKQ